MNTKHFISHFCILAVLVVLVLGFTTGSASATPAGTAFTYQGQLTQGGSAVTGSCDFHFGLWDALSGGNQVPGTTTLTLNGVMVTDGLFTVQLDFGAGAFTGEARWLEIGVKCAGDSTYTTLAPRQPLTPAPYALYAPAAGNATTVTNGVYTTGSYAYPGWLTALAGSKITGSVASATDANTVDGQHASAFASASHNHWGASWSGTGTGLSLSGGTIGLSGSGSTYGVSGQSDVAGGKGIYGHASATTGTSDGVFGQSDSANGSGVVGNNSGEGWGVFGWSAGTSNPGVEGMAMGTGVSGISNGASGVTYGVVGQVNSPDGYAGNFNSTTGNGVTINVPAGKVGLNVTSGLAQVGGNTIWNAGNDGSGSGLDADMLDGVHAASFWNLTGNSGTVAGTNFLGTLDNVALEFKVNNSRALRLGPNATSPNIIGGYSGNSVTAGVVGAGISGGGYASNLNQVTDDYGVVGGGAKNQAGDAAGTTSDTPFDTVGGGYTNTASGGVSTVSGGYLNTASGPDSTVGGGYENTASGFYSTIAGGMYASATHYGEAAHASGRFASTGDAQTSEYVLRNTTTDGNMTGLYLDGSSNRITLASNRTLSFDILIVAHSSTGGSSAGYQITGLIEYVGGTTALVGTPVVTVLGEDVPAWDATVTADDTNKALVIWVTGAASTTIRWVASVRTVEVGW